MANPRPAQLAADQVRFVSEQERTLMGTTHVAPGLGCLPHPEGHHQATVVLDSPGWHGVDAMAVVVHTWLGGHRAHPAEP